MILMYSCRIVGQIDSHITIVTEIIGEVFLDDVLLISTAYNKLIEPIMAIYFHDMSKNGFAPDFYHRLRAVTLDFARS